MNWPNFVAEHRTKLVHGTVLLTIGITYFAVVIPVFHVNIPCVFNEVTGFFCPGCGMTRCILSIMNFEVLQAFRYNMMPFILGPLLLVHSLLKWRGMPKASNYLMWSMLLIAISYGILRNVEEFAWLAPTPLDIE